MKKHHGRTKSATRDRSREHVKETVPCKTYNLRKRKCESGQYEQDNIPTKVQNSKRRRIQKEPNTPTKFQNSKRRRIQLEHNTPTKVQNSKRKRIQLEHNDQRTDRRVKPSARGRKRHPTDVDKSNDKAKLQGVKMKESLKRKTVKKSEGGTHLDVGFQKKKAQRVLRSSIKHTEDRKEKVNKHPISKICLQIKKNRDKEDLPSRNLLENLRKQSRQRRTTNPRVKSPTFNKSSHQEKKENFRLNSPLNSKAESYKKSKANMIKQTLPRNERTILVKEIQNTVALKEETYAKDFSNLFLAKITIKHYPTIEQKVACIHGVCVSENNLVWVNQLGGTVYLRNTTGEVIRTFEVDFRPVFNCCTPSGDVLITQGYGGSKPIITSISKEGDVKVLADLSSIVSNLCGILYQDEKIFVVAHHANGKKYFIMKLNKNGEFECVYHTQKASDDINQIISLNGQIVAIRAHSDGLIPLEADQISSAKMNKVNITLYSASASVDKFGNVIMASNASLFIINPSLEFMHEIDTGISEEIISTAVDQQNQLWFGTRSGELYSTKYLK
ncbi:uncharacterized protein LOC133175851 [Saccostrea echinata]|uniref:uncharacterized protein LOC133175851 n=1 Tax=Saccostrea echinata TaxID=191078 RepID=UPI002A80A54D|nr:uncharacterized protein LOC133175851 [Saccostrea echinata]